MSEFIEHRASQRTICHITKMVSCQHRMCEINKKLCKVCTILVILLTMSILGMFVDGGTISVVSINDLLNAADSLGEHLSYVESGT